MSLAHEASNHAMKPTAPSRSNSASLPRRPAVAISFSLGQELSKRVYEDVLMSDVTPENFGCRLLASKRGEMLQSARGAGVCAQPHRQIALYSQHSLLSAVSAKILASLYRGNRLGGRRRFAMHNSPTDIRNRSIDPCFTRWLISEATLRAWLQTPSLGPSRKR